MSGDEYKDIEIQEDDDIELSEIDAELKKSGSEEETSNTPQGRGLQLGLQSFKGRLEEGVGKIEWGSYVGNEDIERVKAINTYCLNIYKERRGEKNLGENLKYMYSVMAAVSLYLKSSSWWSTGFILAAGALTCNMVRIFINNLQGQADYFKSQYDKLDGLLGKVSSVDLSIAILDSSTKVRKIKSFPHGVTPSTLDMIRTESDNNREYERELLHVYATIAITFLNLEKKLTLKIEDRNSNLQVNKHFINMLKACLKNIVERKENNESHRFTPAVANRLGQVFARSIEKEYARNKLAPSSEIFREKRAVSTSHFLTDIEKNYNSTPKGSVANSNKIGTFDTLNAALFIEKNEIMGGEDSKAEINRAFIAMSAIVRNQTNIQNRLIFINTLSIVSCWLLGVGINQDQMPYPKTSISSYLSLMGSAAFFLGAQWFASNSDGISKTRNELRQAKTDYRASVLDAIDRKWVGGEDQIDVVHRINKSIAKTWDLLGKQDLPISKFRSEDVAIISMNMFNALCKAMKENGVDSLKDEDVKAIAHNWQRYIADGTYERFNFHRWLSDDAKVQAPAVVFFSKMPAVADLSQIACKVLINHEGRISSPVGFSPSLGQSAYKIRFGMPANDDRWQQQVHAAKGADPEMGMVLTV